VPPYDEFSCAAFPRDLDETKLIARYGRENVKSALVSGWDEREEGTVVFPDQDDRKLEIWWWDSESKKRLHWIRTRGTGSPWTAINGIRVGMDLKAIERRNGWPFRLRGFIGEGYPGAVVTWEKGRLKSADQSSGCTDRVYLLPVDEVRARPQWSRQLGRGEFSSGHPAMQALNPRVYQMTVNHDWR
jgi:hypothetical protein